MAIADAAAEFAADANGDGNVTLLDENIVYNATIGMGITSNPYAA